MISIKTVTATIVLTFGLISNAAAANVLYFFDFFAGTNYWTTVFSQRGDSVTTVTTTGDLATKLGQGPWDVVVIAQNNESNTSYFPALQTYVGAGGRVVFNNWYRFDGFDSLFQATVSATNQTLISANNPTNVPLVLTNAGWGIFSQTLTLIPVGGQSICEFSTGNSCAVLGNSGRTVRLGLIPDALPASHAVAFLAALLDAVGTGSVRTFEQNIATARALLGQFQPTSPTGIGQRNTMVSQLGLVLILKDQFPGLALQLLNSVIARTDGCALRGSPDTLVSLGATGMDFIFPCPAQGPIYAALVAARPQIQP